MGWGIGVGLILVAAFAITWPLLMADDGSVPQGQAFFSDDGGKTFFAGPQDQVVPFARDGKQVVMAAVTTCGGGPAKVSYLLRYTEETRAQLAEIAKSMAGVEAVMQADITRRSGTEVQRVGDNEWYAIGSAEATKITTVLCPDGTPATPILP